jgi:hypothetical protein
MIVLFDGGTYIYGCRSLERGKAPLDTYGRL